MTATETLVAPIGARRRTLPLLFGIAARELRSGISGFRIFIACVALGVMVITGVGAVSDALRSGFESQGEALLGGDLTLTRTHERSQGEEREKIDSLGWVSETATMRTMARRPDGGDQALAELKSVDEAYPLVGEVELEDGRELYEALSEGAVVDPTLLERLKLKVGDEIEIGAIKLKIASALKAEPDGLTDRLTFGPRVFISDATLEQSELLKPGTLVRWRYAVKLEDGNVSDAALAGMKPKIEAMLPEAGFTVMDRREPSPRISRTLDRLREFLTFIGLTALLVGGVGIANAVATFIDKRRKVIATMKSIGATSRMVLGIFLVEVLAVASVGVVIGLVLGLLLPYGLNALFGGLLPIEAKMSVSMLSIVTALVYGFGVALLFTLWPLGRVERVSASMLFRDEVAPDKRWPSATMMAATFAIALALAGFALLTSDSTRIAFSFIGGLIVVFAVFHALGVAITWAARRVRRPRQPELALAIANIGAPGGLTRSVVLSLGAGLSLLVAVALADASLVRELQDGLPTRAPDYFMIDVPKDDMAAVDALLKEKLPGTVVDAEPMLRGRLVRLKDKPVEEFKLAPEDEWVLSGDRGLSYSEEVPKGSRLVDGEWWPKDYAGEPLVSFEARLAEKLGLKIGDEVTVNVLGRNVTAKIASTRAVKWENLSINFVMVFSPNTLAGAPHNLLATVTLPENTSPAAENAAMRAMGHDYPSVTAIRVKDMLSKVGSIFTQVMTAVRGAGSLTLLAGALVLAGALATAQRRRILEAVILKTLGATRRRILTAHFAEYLVLATVTALVAAVVGSIAAALVVTQIMKVSFSFSLGAVGLALGLSMALVFIFGSAGTWAVLRAPPVPYLRSE